MLDPKDYNNLTLDKETRDQLFKTWVEGKFLVMGEAIADLHQKIFQLQQQVSGYEAVFRNINKRLDAHENELQNLWLFMPQKVKNQKFTFWRLFK